jgi:hypothetical protein
MKISIHRPRRRYTLCRSWERTAKELSRHATFNNNLLWGYPISLKDHWDICRSSNFGQASKPRGVALKFPIMQRNIPDLTLWRGQTLSLQTFDLFPGSRLFFFVIILYRWIPRFNQSWIWRFRFEFRVICSFLRILFELVCLARYLHPLSRQQNTKSFFFCVVFSILEHPRSSLSVPSLQASVSVAISLPCLGGGSKAVTSLSLHHSTSCQRFNRPRSQDKCEKAGKGGASLLLAGGPFAYCWMWTTWGKWRGVAIWKRRDFCGDSPSNL